VLRESQEPELSSLSETSPRYDAAALYVNLGASADLAPTAARVEGSGPRQLFVVQNSLS